MDRSTIAVILSGVSTVVSCSVFIRDHLRTRARARVRTGYNAVAGLGDEPSFVIVASIANIGREPIFLASAGIEAGTLTMTGVKFHTAPPLPIELKPGQSFAGDYLARQIWPISSYGEFREIRAVFYDQVGRRYVGDWVPAGEIRKTETGWSLELADRPTLFQRLLASLRGRGKARRLPPKPP